MFIKVSVSAYTRMALILPLQYVRCTLVLVQSFVSRIQLKFNIKWGQSKELSNDKRINSVDFNVLQKGHFVLSVLS